MGGRTRHWLSGSKKGMTGTMNQTIRINTGLTSNLMIKEIQGFHSSRIWAISDINNANGPIFFPVLEAMAQLGALHVRYLNNFQWHVFLVKVAHIILPDRLPVPTNAVINLQADMLGNSDRSFSYRIQAWEKNHVVIEGDFWFSTIDYDERFNAAALQPHYRDLWTCLTSVLPTD